MREIDDNALVSIIVPVYNVEKYITKCIQSLLDQTYKNFEAIIVDDGSLDNSIQIAKSLVGDDSRFIFLEKENGGQGSARNIGIDHATGQYISFLDSDDYFSHDFLKKMLDPLQKNAFIDITMCGYQRVKEDGSIIDSFMPNITYYKNNKDILLSYEYINYGVCNKVYRMEVWNNYRFNTAITYEDKEILPIVIHNCSLHLIDEYLHFYVYRKGSTMNTYSRQKSVSSVLYIYDKYLEFLTTEKLYEQYKDYYEKSYIKFCFYRQISMLLSFSDSYVQDSKYLMKQLDLNIIANKKIIRLFGMCSKVTLSLLMFKVSPRLLKSLYAVQQKIKSVLKFNQ
ncbi:glycosyltransferase family 2 protein [Wohlfahrtiimonas larvae]|nr:glycosyltransferase family 2 protein [Wohlfahrtiimonas larvae]